LNCCKGLHCGVVSSVGMGCSFGPSMIFPMGEISFCGSTSVETNFNGFHGFTLKNRTPVSNSLLQNGQTC